jgi:CDGSH-type Zn-finger protein
MDKPTIADKKPAIVNLEAKKYYWCACGLSKAQPFCDGSHKGTSFQPLAFDVETPKKGVLCNCKYTKNPPFCDGSHSSL